MCAFASIHHQDVASVRLNVDDAPALTIGLTFPQFLSDLIEIREWTHRAWTPSK
jgi:hypothetical protein